MSGDLSRSELPAHLGKRRERTKPTTMNERVITVQQRAGEQTEQRFPGRAGHAKLIYAICLLLPKNLMRSLEHKEHKQKTFILFKAGLLTHIIRFPLSTTHIHRWQLPLHCALHSLPSSSSPSPLFRWDQRKPAGLRQVSERPT